MKTVKVFLKGTRAHISVHLLFCSFFLLKFHIIIRMEDCLLRQKGQNTSLPQNQNPTQAVYFHRCSLQCCGVQWSPCLGVQQLPRPSLSGAHLWRSATTLRLSHGDATF